MHSSPGITFSQGFKRLLLVLALCNCLIGIKRITESFFAPNIYKKDIIQEYLMAQAIRQSVNPYLPLPELAHTYLSASDFNGVSSYNALNHPTPHTPIVGLLSLPLGLLSYQGAVLAWLVFESACLLASLLLLVRWWGKPFTTNLVPVYFVLVLGWLPIIEDFCLGQLSSFLLLLLLGAWLTLRTERYFLGGALLGGLIALKLTAWPIVIFLALRRNWRGVMAAAGVILIANLIAMAVLGYPCIKDYYLHIGPSIATIYRSHDTNYSMWTIGQRLFVGFGYNISVAPLWSSALLAEVCTYMIPICILMGGLWLAVKAQSLDTAFGLLVGVGILVSPIAWSHYITLAVIPILILSRRLLAKGCPRQESYLSFCLCLPISIPGPAYSAVTAWTATQTTPAGIPIVSVAVGLLTLLPAAALMGLLWLVWRTDQVQAQNSN